LRKGNAVGAKMPRSSQLGSAMVLRAERPLIEGGGGHIKAPETNARKDKSRASRGLAARGRRILVFMAHKH
jgi:hypothetical protein